MTDRPVIFSRPMIRALLAGHKTQTRRLAWVGKAARIDDDGNLLPAKRLPSSWQRVKPGDRLYARERLCSHNGFGFPLSMMPQTDMRDNRVWSYFADDVPEEITGGRPSIHCPRTFSRITLVVDAVKIEPLQAITEEDAAAEGIVMIPRLVTMHGRLDGYGSPGTKGVDASTTRRNAFERLWRGLHGSESWDANPEVVAMSGRVILENIDKVPA